MEWWNFLTQTSAAHPVVLLVRLLLAIVLGGAIGFERGLHGRAAGMRTHMLVSIGAALAAIIGIHISIAMHEMGINSDVQRTGAQVISGIGFLGAGTILLKRGNSQITGLTTAAGLWATAAIGLSVGYGLYLAALITACLCILIFTVMSKLEFTIRYKRQRVFVYVEIDDVNVVTEVSDYLHDKFNATELTVTKPRSGTSPHVGIEALVKVPGKDASGQVNKAIEEHEHIVFALTI